MLHGSYRVKTPSAMLFMSLSTSVATILIHISSHLWPVNLFTGCSLPPWSSSFNLQIPQAADGFVCLDIVSSGVTVLPTIPPALCSRLSASSKPLYRERHINFLVLSPTAPWTPDSTCWSDKPDRPWAGIAFPPICLRWETWPTLEVAASSPALLSRSLPLAAFLCFSQLPCHSSGIIFTFVGSYLPCRRVGTSSSPEHTQPAWSAALSLSSPSGSLPRHHSHFSCCKITTTANSPFTQILLPVQPSLSFFAPWFFFFNGRDWLYWFFW